MAERVAFDRSLYLPEAVAAAAGFACSFPGFDDLLVSLSASVRNFPAVVAGSVATGFLTSVSISLTNSVQ